MKRFTNSYISGRKEAIRVVKDLQNPPRPIARKALRADVLKSKGEQKHDTGNTAREIYSLTGFVWCSAPLALFLAEVIIFH